MCSSRPTAVRVAFSGHLPALDGLRAFGALSVMAMHCGVLLGGYAGVDLFFVLSGFLITSVILREIEDTGTLSFVNFYFRRSLRLFPALFTVCLTAFVAISWTRTWQAAVNEVSPAITYVSDVTRHKGWPDTLAHTWSLSLEEQFYIVWPLVLAPLAAFGARRFAPIPLFICAIAVGVWRSYLFHKHLYWSRPFDWPDVRSDGVMIGCALALLEVEHLRILAKLWPLAVTAVAAYFGFVDWETGTPYDGGLIAFSFSSAVLIAKLVTDPDSRCGKIFSNFALVRVGQISYGLYLWHYLIFKLLPHMPRFHTTVAVFALSFACAALMYRYIERPLLKLRDERLPSPLIFAIASISITLLAAGLVLLATNLVPVFAIAKQ